MLAKNRARYAVVAILSYNNVPLTDMAEAFAGFMLRAADPHSGQVIDPSRGRAAVRHHTGPGKVSIPLVVDLAGRTMRWPNVNARVTGTNHAVHRHHDQFGLWPPCSRRPSTPAPASPLGELARWHAATRAGEVLVCDGERVQAFRRHEGETVPAFAERLQYGVGGELAPAREELLAGVACPACGTRLVYAQVVAPEAPVVCRAPGCCCRGEGCGCGMSVSVAGLDHIWTHNRAS